MADSFILHTPRLRLVPFKSEELELLHHTFTNPFVREYLWDNEMISREQTREILEKSQLHFAREGWGLWKVCLKEDHTYAGFAGLWYFFDEVRPQLLYGLLPSCTKRGYATEAAQAVLTYAFDVLGFTYVTASCDAPHSASRSVAERLHMTFVGEEKKHGRPTAFYRLQKTPEAADGMSGPTGVPFE